MYNSYFFSSANLLSIGVLRIILVFLSASNLFRNLDTHFQDAMLNELHERSLLVDFLGNTVFYYIESSLFSIIFIASAIGSLIGLFTRPSLFIFGLYVIYLTGLRTSMGIFDHSYSLISQVILILAFIPGSTNLSLDRAFKWFLNYKKGLKPPVWELLYRPLDKVWGVRLLLILLACVYFTAGFSKVRYGGVKWLDGNTLSHYLSGNASPTKQGFTPPMFLSDRKVTNHEKWKDGFGLYGYSYGNRQSNSFALKAGNFVANNPYLIISLSILTVIFELCSFCLLIDRWPRNLYLAGAIMLHTSIGFFMNLVFIQFRIICFLLIDWQWVFNQVSALIKKRRLKVKKQLTVSAAN